jgi:hypothetical protein
MKRIIIFLGLPIAIVVPTLLVGQNKPNVTEYKVVEPNIPDPNCLISQKTELELKVIQLEYRVDQLEKQIKILFIDSLYNRENIIQLWEGEMAIIDDLSPRGYAKEGALGKYQSPLLFGYPLPKDDRPYRPFRHKEKMAWKEFIDRVERMVEDPCDIKQKR